MGSKLSFRPGAEASLCMHMQDSRRINEKQSPYQLHWQVRGENGTDRHRAQATICGPNH